MNDVSLLTSVFSKLCSSVQSYPQITTVPFDIVQPLLIRFPSQFRTEGYKDIFLDLRGTRDYTSLRVCSNCATFFSIEKAIRMSTLRVLSFFA